MKINHVVVILMILLSISLFANVYLLVREQPAFECKPSWEYRNGDYYKFDCCGNILEVVTKEEINKMNMTQPKDFKFDDDGMGLTIYNSSGFNLRYRLTTAWNLSTAIYVGKIPKPTDLSDGSWCAETYGGTSLVKKCKEKQEDKK